MSQLPEELYQELYTMTKTLLAHGSTTDMIEKHLAQKTDDPVLMAVVIKEAKKDHYAAARKEGQIWLAIGSVLIVGGFLITCFNFHAGRSVDIAMYGLTSLGLCFVFWALYKMIG